MIEQDRKEWVVITSDREIMDHAWKHGSVPVPSDQFMSRLEHAEADNDLKGNDEFFEENDSTQLRKGSPRQRSKKEKALIRVLNKL